MRDENMDQARAALYEVLASAHEALYTTKGTSWRQIVASLAFETKADLSLLQYFDEQDQARFALISQAFMDKELTPDEIADVYLEFFPRPLDIEGWRGDEPSF